MEQTELFPHVNDSIRRSTAGGPPTETWEFICECPDVGCHTMVSVTLIEFDRRRAASPPLSITADHHGLE